MHRFDLLQLQSRRRNVNIVRRGEMILGGNSKNLVCLSTSTSCRNTRRGTRKWHMRRFKLSMERMINPLNKSFAHLLHLNSVARLPIVQASNFSSGRKHSNICQASWMRTVFGLIVALVVTFSITLETGIVCISSPTSPWREYKTEPQGPGLTF